MTLGRSKMSRLVALLYRFFVFGLEGFRDWCGQVDGVCSLFSDGGRGVGVVDALPLGIQDFWLAPARFCCLYLSYFFGYDLVFVGMYLVLELMTHSSCLLLALALNRNVVSSIFTDAFCSPNLAAKMEISRILMVNCTGFFSLRCTRLYDTDK